MEKGIQRIDNLLTHFEENEGDHVIFTGTFDPFHNGHMYTTLQALNARNVRETQNPVLVFPHNRSPHKYPASIEARRIWIEHALLAEDIELPIRENVAIVSDPTLINDSEAWRRLKERFRDRILRVIGDDKKHHVKDPNLIVVPRMPHLSSSQIRNVVRTLELERLEDVEERLSIEGVSRAVARGILKAKEYRE